MTKFNVKTVRATGVSPIRAEKTASGRTYEGAPGYRRDARGELFLLAVSNMVNESAFYETAAGRDDRFTALIRQLAVTDADWLARLIGWLRDGANMRSASLVAAVEMVRARLEAGAHGGNRQVISSVLRRADEPGELLAYWISRYGRAIPQPVKRGVSDAVARLYTERSLAKYDTESHGFRFADVLELAHPAPAAPWQGDLFRHAIDRRHGRGEEIPGTLAMVAARRDLLALPVDERRAALVGPGGREMLANAGMTWESVAGWLQGPLDAAAWEAVIPSMGYMALLRNLRNFDDAGVSNQVAERVAARLADPERVAASRQLPMRFLSAYRAISRLRWAPALEDALGLSLANVPSLPGRTLILIDRSGSMFWSPSRLSKLTQADVAAMFGSALAVRAERADLVQFGSSSQAVNFRRNESVLRVLERFDNLGGTQTAAAVRRHYGGHDRVLIVTDEQAWAGYHGQGPTAVIPASVPVYTWNLAGYRHGHGPSGSGNRHTFGGLTDAAFTMIGLIEAGQAADWPF